jgi:hypothetical protein
MEPGTRKKTRYVQLAVGIIERTAFAQRSGNGRLAQLGERLPYKQEGACSSHAPPIEEGPGNGAFLVSGRLRDVAFATDWNALWNRQLSPEP